MVEIPGRQSSGTGSVLSEFTLSRARGFHSQENAQP